MNKNLTPAHAFPQYFQSPVHRIRVHLIGAGGNGSQMLSALARIDHALRELGRTGLEVTVWDPDTVEAPNIGRQLFTSNDIGKNKAECLVTRFNRIYQNNWKSVPKKWGTDQGENLPNIIITCVDNKKTRMDIGKLFTQKRSNAKKLQENENYLYYWLDLGNGQRTGQAILGSNPIRQPEKSDTYHYVDTLPTITELVDFKAIDEKDSGPSCSLAEALTKQDLFINSSLVQMAGSLLWSMFSDLGTETQGFYLNLDTYRCVPVPVREPATEETDKPAKQ